MRQYKIIDAHAHIFPEKIAGKAVETTSKYYGITMSCRGTIEDLLEKGRIINVQKYLVHSTATKVEQVKAVNDFIADAKHNNSCFIGFGTLHPDMHGVKNEIDRIISLGLKGVKLHPEFQQFNIDDNGMMPIYKELEGRLPVLMHMGDEKKTSSSPERLSKVLNMFPKLTVIAAHLGGYRMWNDSVRYLLGKNVYFDTSSSLPFLDKKAAVDIIRLHSVKRVLFGTDYPMWTHEEELQRFLSLELTECERELILSENANKLFNIF